MTPPSPIIETLMLAASAGLGALAAHLLFAREAPTKAIGLTIGFGALGWAIGFVAMLFLRQPGNVASPRPYPDWRGMDYITWTHTGLILAGFALVLMLHKRALERSLSPDFSFFKALIGAAVLMLLCLILTNTLGFLATLRRTLFGTENEEALP